MAEIRPQVFGLDNPNIPEKEGNGEDEEASVQKESPIVLPEPARSRSRLRLFAVLAGLFVCIFVQCCLDPGNSRN